MLTEGGILADVLTWSGATVPLAGEPTSGDRWLARQSGDDVLLAAVDGLGHGAEAESAAARAIEVLARHASEPVIPLLRLCHEALRGTRGAALSLARVVPAQDTLIWLGVGNVMGLVVRADRATEPPRESLLLRGGVVGYNLPALVATVLPLGPGDLVLLATDGIVPDFGDGVIPGEAPGALAERLLRQYARTTDDALVLAARYRVRD